MGVLGMLSSGNLQCFPHTEPRNFLNMKFALISLQFVLISMQLSLFLPLIPKFAAQLPWSHATLSQVNANLPVML